MSDVNPGPSSTSVSFLTRHLGVQRGSGLDQPIKPRQRSLCTDAHDQPGQTRKLCCVPPGRVGAGERGCDPFREYPHPPLSISLTLYLSLPPSPPLSSHSITPHARSHPDEHSGSMKITTHLGRGAPGDQVSQQGQGSSGRHSLRPTRPCAPLA